MKKRVLSSLIAPLSLFLVSCGGMDGWPYCSIPDETEYASSVLVELQYKTTDDDGNTAMFTRTFTTVDQAAIAELHATIEAMHVSPKTYHVSLDTYKRKAYIEFDISSDNIYTFEFYEKGVANGYFVFNGSDEVYAFKGNFYNVIENLLTQGEYADCFLESEV